MDNLEKLIIGVVTFTITSVIAYLFRLHQLYAVAPKLYKHSPVSSNGCLSEIIVYNNGNQVEEDIQVELDPELKCELLASSSSKTVLEGTTLKTERLHKGCEESVILLVENGILDSTKILSISSKGTKGKVHKKISEVPPNYAKLAMVFTLLIGFLPALIYGKRAYDYIDSEWSEYKLASIQKQGWSGLTRYYSSDLKQSYSNQEFPVRYIEQKLENGRLILVYEIYNKTAAPLVVYADKKSIRSVKEDLVSPYFSSAEVPPMSKQTLNVKAPFPSDGVSHVEMDFSFKSADEFIFGIMNAVEIDKVRNSPSEGGGEKQTKK